MRRWATVGFQELAGPAPSAIAMGPFGSKVKSDEYVDEGVPFLRGANIARGAFLDDDFVFITAEKASEIPSALVGPGDLVFTCKGTIGQVSMIPAESRFGRYAISSNQMKASLDRSRAMPNFYYYWFRSPLGQQALLANSSNVGVPKIANPLTTLRSIRVPSPSLEEQKAIADVLGALDDKIAVNSRIAYGARDLGLSVFVSALESRSQEHDIGSLAELVTRGVTPHYSDNESDLLVLNQKCIRGGRISFGPVRRTARDKVRSEKLLRAHDVVVNSTGVGTLGRVAMWNSVQECTVDTHVTIVRFDVAKTDPLCAGFGMLLAQPQIEVMGEGSTGQTELSRTKLAAMRLTLPARETMQVLRPSLEALEARAEKALVESDSLARLRDALLPKLMSGEIRVWDAEKVVEGAT